MGATSTFRTPDETPLATLRSAFAPMRGTDGERRAVRIVFVACLLAALAVNAAVLLQDRADPLYLYRDQLMIAGINYGIATDPTDTRFAYCCASWWGLVSNLGIVVWLMTAGMLLMGLAATIGPAARGRQREVAVFFAIAATLTALFGIDDLFQIHEEKALFGPLKGEAILFPLYAVMIASYALFGFVRRGPERMLLAAALAGFAVSVLADQTLPQEGVTVVIEDSAKFFAIVFWAGFHGLLVARIIGAFPESEAAVRRVATGTAR